MSDDTKLLTPIGILASNPQTLWKVFPNREDPSKEGSFYARIIFTAADMKSPAWTNLMNALGARATETFGKNAIAMIKEGGIKYPVRKDLTTKGYDPEQFACYLNLNAYADNPPALIDINAGPLESRGLLRIGCKVRASVYITSYDRKDGGKGVNLKLKAVQFAGDGPGGLTLPTKGGGDGSGDFGALEPIENAAEGGGDSLTDLLA